MVTLNWKSKAKFLKNYSRIYSTYLNPFINRFFQEDYIIKIEGEKIVLYTKNIVCRPPVIVQPEPSLEAVQDASFVFNGPQFFAALIAGVILAFCFSATVY